MALLVPAFRNFVLAGSRRIKRQWFHPMMLNEKSNAVANNNTNPEVKNRSAIFSKRLLALMFPRLDDALRI